MADEEPFTCAIKTSLGGWWLVVKDLTFPCSGVKEEEEEEVMKIHTGLALLDS